MNNYEVGNIIVQTIGNPDIIFYEIIEANEFDEVYFCKSSRGGITRWVSRKTLDKFIEDGKGYIKGFSNSLRKNRLDSIDD